MSLGVGVSLLARCHIQLKPPKVHLHWGLKKREKPEAAVNCSRTEKNDYKLSMITAQWAKLETEVKDSVPPSQNAIRENIFLSHHRRPLPQSVFAAAAWKFKTTKLTFTSVAIILILPAVLQLEQLLCLLGNKPPECQLHQAHPTRPTRCQSSPVRSK